VSKKGDARIARGLEGQLKNQEKSARLVERVKAEIPVGRTIRVGVDPSQIYQMHMDWSDAEADRAGSWTWGAREWSQEAWDGVIGPKLANFKTMLWRELEAAITDSGHRMHHSMAVEVICDECQTRLLELEKVDGDIYRFRLGNRRRLWGFRTLNVFEILWYDPEHNVYPVEPD
jgi:hypothetical protein